MRKARKARLAAQTVLKRRVTAPRIPVQRSMRPMLLVPILRRDQYRLQHLRYLTSLQRDVGEGVR